MKFENYDIIEQYLEGTLSSGERNQFEQALLENPALQSKVDAHRLASDLIIDHRLLEVSGLVNVQHQQEKKLQKTQKVVGYSILGIVATVASIFMYNKSSSNNTASTPTTISEKTVEINEPTASEEELNEVQPLVETQKTSGKTASSEKTALQEEEEEIDTPTHAEPVVESTTLSETKDQAEATRPQPVDTETLCAQTKISAQITSSGSCPDAFEGSINVTNLQGGATPYEVFISNPKGQVVKNFQALSPGSYQVDIVDANGCLQSMESVRVNSLDCTTKISFNPFTGDEVHFHEHYDNGYVKVYNQQSIVVFEGDLNTSNELTWNGYNNQGKIEEGYYIFSVELSNGKTKTGEITLLK